MAVRPSAARKASGRKAPAKTVAARGGAARPKTAAGRATATAASTVTLKAIFEQLAEAHALPRKQAHALMADFVSALTTHLSHGKRVRMSGIGILEVKMRAARTGRNPATGETIQIKASKKVGFRAAKELKTAI
jgi:DNA-binding protein HU-beta